MSKTRKELESSINKLSLSSQNNKKASSTPKKKPKPVVDSWEDDDLSSGQDTDRPIEHQSSNDYPSAPPPTPSSPTATHNGNTYPFENWGPIASYDGASSPRPNERSNVRPEKTDAVAKRLIAGALGVKAPKKTDEQRAYDKAVKEKEMKRRNGEKEAKKKAEEDAARAKKEIWAD